ncbi:MAG: hypothetical protein LBL07_19870 [Tannerella sp.]|jgi:hypothetical protein|nr:hypothetical protein [Tannerella sp.]
MCKKIILAAFFAACVWMVGATVNETAAVTATDVYVGTASNLVMNGNSVSGSYPGSFEIDEDGNIYGSFDVVNDSGAVIHHFILDGNLLDGIATGTVSLPPNGNTVPFGASFSNVSFSGNSVTFSCTATTATIPIITSSFTFSGIK